MPLTLILLHYWAGSGRAWSAVRQAAARRAALAGVELLSPDLPGFGGELLADPALAPTVASAADFVRALIQERGLTSYALVGHSMGGKIALALAATSPPPGLRAIGLIAPSPPGPEPMTGYDRWAARHAYGNSRQAARTARRLTAKPLPGALQAQVVADSLATQPAAWHGWLDAGSREDWRVRVAGHLPDVPVFLLSSWADPVLPTAVQHEHTLPYLPATTQHQQLHTGGHLLPLERPVVVANWLAGTVVAASPANTASD